MSPWQKSRYMRSMHVALVFVLALVVGACMVYFSGGHS